MTKKVVIIGAGISGLSAGCYAQRYGFTSEIYEMHSIAGGVCTSWKRGEYLFDHCLHWVIGSNKGTNLYPIFKDLGITDGVEFHYTDIFRHIISDKKSLKVYTDINLFEKELLTQFPNEAKGIKKYIGLIRKYLRFNPPMDGDFGDFSYMEYVKMIPFLPSFIKLKSITIEKYLNSLFDGDDIKEMLFRLFPVKNLPALMAVLPLSFMHKKEGGYPLGGSLKFAQVIEKQYKGTGGKIHYNSKVKKIIIENGIAKGIELEDGRIVLADVVISACDGHTLIYKMLEGKYVSDKISQFYHKPDLWPPLISISLGVNKDFSEEAEITDFILKEPVDICGNIVEWSGFFHYCHDQTFAPAGKSVIQAQIESDYEYWEKLYRTDRKAYYNEKNIVLEKYINILEQRFPGIKELIEVSDVATPVTWERYTGNWKGSYEGWMPTVKTFGTSLPKTLPGLKSFYMTGQWTFPGGGVPLCMAQGRNIVRAIVQEINNKKGR
jgi:phytoene dehydrogenase-like protein